MEPNNVIQSNKDELNNAKLNKDLLEIVMLS